MDINEGLIYLQELIRTANNLISPMTYNDDLEWISNKDLTKKLFEKCPHCFISLNYKDKQTALFPICNRMAIHDPKIINFSIKLAKRLIDKPNVDQENLIIIISKLEKLVKKYSKEIPKTEEMAVLKTKSTKHLSKIKKYIKG